MDTVLNLQKRDRIREHGQAVDLPLFDTITAKESPTYVVPDGTPARNDAYYSTPVKKLQRNEMIVLAALKNIQPASDRQISEALKWPINCVTGRRNTLLKSGRVEKYGTAKDAATGKTVTLWRVA